MLSFVLAALTMTSDVQRQCTEAWTRHEAQTTARVCETAGMELNRALDSSKGSRVRGVRLFAASLPWLKAGLAYRTLKNRTRARRDLLMAQALLLEVRDYNVPRYITRDTKSALQLLSPILYELEASKR